MIIFSSRRYAGSDFREKTQLEKSSFYKLFEDNMDTLKHTLRWLILGFTADHRLPRCCLMPSGALSGATVSV